MLTALDAAPNAIFLELARRSGAITGEPINAAEIYLQQALKVQAQCRAMLAMLATIKNLPVVYARQANTTTGPQPGNNDMAAREPVIRLTREPTIGDGQASSWSPERRAHQSCPRKKVAAH